MKKHTAPIIAAILLLLPVLYCGCGDSEPPIVIKSEPPITIKDGETPAAAIQRTAKGMSPVRAEEFTDAARIVYLHAVNKLTGSERKAAGFNAINVKTPQQIVDEYNKIPVEERPAVGLKVNRN
jgi:hypothetical protein